MADKTQSKIIQAIVKETSLDKSFHGLRISFKLLCDKKGLSCTSDVLGQLSQDDLRTLAVPFLSSVHAHPVPGLLPSTQTTTTTGRSCLRRDLLYLIYAASLNDFNFQNVIPLLITALNRKSDNSLFWDQVYHAVTQLDQACWPDLNVALIEDLSWLRNRTISSTCPKPRQDTDGILKQVIGAFQNGPLHLSGTFFQALGALVSVFRSVFTRWPDGSDLPQECIRYTIQEGWASDKMGEYRFRREVNNEKRVVYVEIHNLTFFPKPEMAWSHTITIKHLSQLSGWYDKWDTLTVLRLGDEIFCLQNYFTPHAIPSEQVVGDYPFFDILDLQFWDTARHSCAELVHNGSELCHLHRSDFRNGIDAISKELKAYHILAKRKPTLASAILGYVYEGPAGRVVGFLSEILHGRYPDINDLEECEKALRQLHSCGVAHGAIEGKDIVITAEGPRFICFCCSRTVDFGESPLPSRRYLERWDATRRWDFRCLKAALLGDTSIGRPCLGPPPG
ncbi:hypothetical protein AYL99_09946 [Fonsecaea erecta]|uniref:Protein kinase domain-containing protein n=1 Tax=Fonsecaea erecta TaxID=1367422 RepID=A0A178Z7N5_9EURO|nr:hypothetical protein AYL99_09946 [Fonsecaea erecta]OAP55794.1 hypothetical protein AYL99_09946 [Fonsecaea erecta]